MSKPTSREFGKKVNDLEKKLEEHELKYLWSVFSQSPLPTLIVQKDGRFIKYNDAMAELTGYTHKEIPDIYTCTLRLYPDEEYRNKVNKISENSRNKKIDVKRDEFIITKKDGEQRHIAFSVYDILYGRNQNDLQVVQGEDITERILAEKALIESEKQFRSLFEFATDLILIMDKNGMILRINSSTTLRLGYTKEEMIGRSLTEFLIPAAKKKCGRKLLILIEKDRHCTEIEFLCKDGKIIITDCSCNVIHDDRGKIVYIITFLRDITERKRREEELIFKTTLLEAQSETTLDGILVVNNEGKSLLFNKRFGEMWNIPTDMLESKDDNNMLNYVLDQIKYPDEFIKKIKYLYDHKCEKSIDEIKFKDGKTFDRWSAPLTDANGRYHGRIWYFRDITGRKKAEEKLKLAQKELEIKTKNLEETNTALKVLLKHQDTEKNIMEKNILSSLKTLVFPYIEKIKTGTSDERQKTYVNIIETNLTEITKPFASKLTEYYTKLTQAEIQIIGLIRENKTAKDIAKILDISVSTVFFHRENIRIKLGLKNKKTNLQSYLQSIPND